MGDVRWQQRLDNYQRALATLERVVAGLGTATPGETERLAIIQAFEFTHELAWKVLKDFLRDQGFDGVVGSKDATRLGFAQGLLSSGEVWMAMIQARNLTSHTYEVETATEIAERVSREFLPAFRALALRMAGLASAADEA